MSQLTCSITLWTCSSHETHRVCFAMLLLLLIPVSRTPAAIFWWPLRHCRSIHKTESSKENCYVSQIRINKPHWIQNGHTDGPKGLPTPWGRCISCRIIHTRVKWYHRLACPAHHQSRNHSARHSMVYKRTVACENPSKKAWTALAKDRISYTSGYVQGSVRSCGTPHLVHCIHARVVILLQTPGLGLNIFLGMKLLFLKLRLFSCFVVDFILRSFLLTHIGIVTLTKKKYSCIVLYCSHYES